MKKIFLSIALVSMTFAFAQKKEIAAAVKAIDAGDTATATAQISAAEASMGGKTTSLEPSVLEQYYYAKGLSLLKGGKNAEGASYLAKLSELGKSKIYSGKDSSKNKVYFVGKEEADKSGIQGLKEESYTVTLAGKLAGTINPLIETANKSAMESYNAKNYSVAAPKFKEVYDLLRAGGEDNKQFLYYSGLNYALAGNKEDAIKVYNDLINSGYTGVRTTYNATSKKTGEVEPLDKTSWDLYKKMGATSEFTDFKVETSKSIENEIYETNAALLIEAGKNDEALALIKKGLEKFPTSAKLTELQGTAYFKSGKMDEFIGNLKTQTKKNPNDANAWYNLGVLESKNPATEADAIASYKKAVEIKPDMVQAWQNLTYITMGDDAKTIDDYNAAKKAGKADVANKIIEGRRARLAATLPYAEKWYQNDANNIDVVKLLKGLYLSAKNDAKFQEFKKKEAEMAASQK
ncbi:tetratricopeptide repeat protein [Kaistella sp. G5-32]|uniref:Tetratricopeptide repeat protein n=1 Tax=Kaistella gelatinilytica TaxID=2787636 RepID=A0ABS0F8U1_9FLAO|nr:tetratricopeptide repeat protein [Kaistella gelatinilytica]MBF8456129.1 tetratricopeptide repeat protein [Kaistella gelatinilytica]